MKNIIRISITALTLLVSQVAPTISSKVIEVQEKNYIRAKPKSEQRKGRDLEGWDSSWNSENKQKFIIDKTPVEKLDLKWGSPNSNGKSEHGKSNAKSSYSWSGNKAGKTKSTSEWSKNKSSHGKSNWNEVDAGKSKKSRTKWDWKGGKSGKSKSTKSDSSMSYDYNYGQSGKKKSKSGKSKSSKHSSDWNVGKSGKNKWSKHTSDWGAGKVGKAKWSKHTSDWIVGKVGKAKSSKYTSDWSIGKAKSGNSKTTKSKTIWSGEKEKKQLFNHNDNNIDSKKKTHRNENESSRGW